MTLLDRLDGQLDARGLAVVPVDGPEQLRVTGPAAEITPEVLAAVEAFKPLLLERLGRADPPRADCPTAPTEGPPAPQPDPAPGGVCPVRGDGQHPAGGPGSGGPDVPAVAVMPGVPVDDDPELDALLAWHAEYCRTKQQQLEREWGDTWQQMQAAEAAGDHPDWVAYLAGQLELRRQWLAENTEWAEWLAGQIARRAIGRLARLGTVSGR